MSCTGSIDEGVSACSFCQKKDVALKRCSECHAAAYCSVACQRNHWKAHKPECISPGKRQKQIQNVATCQNCLQNIISKNPMTCSRCKNATYCCRDCQVNHWKIHKPECQQRVQFEDRVKDLNIGKQMELLAEWKRRAQLCFQATVGMMLSPNNFETQPPQVAILLHVDWNYNLHSFFPVKEPSVVAVTDTLEINGMHTQSVIQQNYIKIKANKSLDKSAKVHFLLTVYDNSMSVTPLLLVPIAKRYSWDQILLLLHDIKFKPPMFVDPWVTSRQSTLKSQLQGMQQALQPQWNDFLHNIFYLRSNTPRHKTHGILILFDFDFGLGKVKSCKEYKAMTLEELRTKCRETQGAAAQPILTNNLDVEHSPVLLQSRKTRPLNQLLVVAFYNKLSGTMFFSPNLVERSDDFVPISVRKSQQIADKMFCRLKVYPFPQVSSPAL
jgi:hypothetical protein